MELKFYKTKHQYKLGKKILTSATQFIGNFHEPFDAKAIARKLGSFYWNKKKKHGMRYWLKEWKEAREHGTRVHDAIEKDIKNIKYPVAPYVAKDWNKIISARDFISSIQEDYLVPEMKVFDEELGIAGTIDLYGNTNDKVTLYDWKTNKAIKKKGYEGKIMFKPIEHLDDCNFNKYALQLSLYAYILERQGKEIDKLYIVHLKEENYKQIEVPYLKEEILLMLSNWNLGESLPK